MAISSTSRRAGSGRATPSTSSRSIQASLRVGREDEQQVERQANREAANLQITFFEEVEQADLDAGGEIRQLVDGEDAAMRARHDAEMDDLRVGIGQSAGGGLDRIDVAEQIGDRHVRRRQLLGVATFARQPFDRRVVAGLGQQPLGPGRDRCQRVVVDLAARQHRHLVVEEIDQSSQNPSLRLAAQPEQNEIVAGQEGVDDAGHDGSLVSDDSRKERLSRRQLGDQVVANLAVNRARSISVGLQLAERACPLAHANCASSQRSASIAALQPMPAAVTA
jgi:hypothetical protein